MTVFDFDALGASGARYQTRENLVTAVRAADAHLQGQIDALSSGVTIVGEWAASSGAFPTTRPDTTAIQAGDAWIVSAAGTVGGEAFAVSDRLIALGAGGLTYAGNWVRAPFEIGDIGAATVTPTGGAVDSLADHLRDALTPTATGGTVAASLAARFGERLAPGDLGAVGDGVANDTTAVQALLTGGFGIGSPRYKHAFQTALTLAEADTKIGGVLRLDLTASIAGSTPALTVSAANVWLDTLIIRIAAGASVERAMRVTGAGFRAERIIIEAETQIANNDATDAALILDAANPWIGGVEITKYDAALHLLATASGFRIDDVIARTLRQGVNLKASDGRIGSIDARGLSPNALALPGENAATITDVSDVRIGSIYSEDAGEHGVYIGGGGADGGTYAEAGARTAGLDIGEAVIRRPGQCGFKVKANVNIHERISLGRLYFEDAAFGSTANANEDGFRAEGVRGLDVAQIVGRSTFNKTTGLPPRSCFVGVHLDGVQRSRLSAIDIDTPASHLVQMLDTKGALSDITIDAMNGRNVGGDALYINSPTRDMGRIFVLQGAVHQVAGAAIRITANSTTSGVTSPCAFGYTATNVSGPGAAINTTDPQIHNDIVIKT